MNSLGKYEYWLDTAIYDLDSAEVMYNSSRWLYVVFMCQQAIEKLVKGLYILYIDDNVPRTHNIRFVFEKFKNMLSVQITDSYYNLFDDLSVYYLNGRYTDYKQKLNEWLDKSGAYSILKRSKEAFSWLLTLKP